MIQRNDNNVVVEETNKTLTEQISAKSLQREMRISHRNTQTQRNNNQGTG